MNSRAITTTTTLPHFSSCRSAAAESSSNCQFHNLIPAKLKLDKQSNRCSLSINCIPSRGIRSASALALTAAEAPPSKAMEMVADKIKRLVLEFKSLAEPIDLVKRLLHYTAMLPPDNVSAREPENLVQGCSTQVWVEAEVDEAGRIRFPANNDSEILKGFCSYLIWMLDGEDASNIS